MLMEDAIVQAPGYMHQALRDEHMHSPIKSTRELRQRLRASLEEATDKASRLWHALLACDTAEAAQLLHDAGAPDAGEAAAAAVVESMDADGSGVVEWEEFKQAFRVGAHG